MCGNGPRRPAIARFAIPLAAALAVSTAAGCAAPSSADPGAGGVLRVGSALALTGDLAEGVLTEQGYQFCADTVNAHGGVQVGGRRLTLSISYADDQSSPVTSARLVREFSDEGIKLILGPYGSAATAADAAVAQSAGQVMVASAGADDNIFSHGYTQVFGVQSPASDYAAAIIDAVVSEARPGPKTVAVVSADDDFSQVVARFAVEDASLLGLKVFPLITFPASSTDLTSVVTRLQAEHPDLVIESGHLVEGVALVVAAAQYRLRPEGIGETVAPTDPTFTKSLGALADGVIGPAQWVPDQPGQDAYFGTAADYARDFRAKFGYTPEYHAAEASAACLALVLAVEHAGSTNPVAVAAALRNLGAPSFFGTLQFAADGQDTTHPMSVIQIQRGHPVTIWPEALAQAPLRWPAAAS
jgi:branched-chain amino acid transport system substrate-binding protein